MQYSKHTESNLGFFQDQLTLKKLMIFLQTHILTPNIKVASFPFEAHDDSLMTSYVEGVLYPHAIISYLKMSHKCDFRQAEKLFENKNPGNTKMDLEGLNKEIDENQKKNLADQIILERESNKEKRKRVSEHAKPSNKKSYTREKDSSEEQETRDSDDEGVRSKIKKSTKNQKSVLESNKYTARYKKYRSTKTHNSYGDEIGGRQIKNNPKEISSNYNCSSSSCEDDEEEKQVKHDIKGSENKRFGVENEIQVSPKRVPIQEPRRTIIEDDRSSTGSSSSNSNSSSSSDSGSYSSSNSDSSTDEDEEKDDRKSKKTDEDDQLILMINQSEARTLEINEDHKDGTTHKDNVETGKSMVEDQNREKTTKLKGKRSISTEDPRSKKMP
jgi:hypothetical protein